MLRNVTIVNFFQCSLLQEVWKTENLVAYGCFQLIIIITQGYQILLKILE